MYVLDTCVITELGQRSPNPHVIDFIESVNEDELYLSVLSLGEIRKVISQEKDLKKTAPLERFYKQLKERFKTRTLEVDTLTMSIWGKLESLAEIAGKRKPVFQNMIGAQAIAKEFIVLSKDKTDFYDDVPVLNIWSKS